MTQKIPYAFYSYSLIHDEEKLHYNEHFKVFNKVQRKPVAYRTVEDDKNAMLVRLKKRRIDGIDIISFVISKKIDERTVSVYNAESDEFDEKIETTEDYARSLVIAIPALGKMAVADRSGEHAINCGGAISRLKKIITVELDGYKLLCEFAATEKEVRSIFKNWKITTVSFNARPFNPHPSTPGDIFSDLLTSNNAKVRGSITPNKAEWLKDPQEGIINELIGLGSKGYAEYGAMGKTDKGFTAKIDKARIEDNAMEPRKIRVYFPERSNLDTHIEDVVSAMRIIYEEK